MQLTRRFRFCAYRKWKWAYLELEMLLFARLSYGLALFAPFPDDPMQMWDFLSVFFLAKPFPFPISHVSRDSLSLIYNQ